ncbi:MAG: DNA-binding response regulator [Firmicutes bacterium HGW-Firmicutes-20]|nr:MAG: DNA-binding response regulator [Firmicutes bacterium HGW-Firmicutes-20]PKM69594.1 MAG: DNA-binding response regulator [Firmicutes bacterium HGW-Firmicutes-19]
MNSLCKTMDSILVLRTLTNGLNCIMEKNMACLGSSMKAGPYLESFYHQPKRRIVMYKVMIVEDEELVRRGISLLTHWDQFDMKLIGEAKNGAEGLEMALKFRPDIILTDIRMPVLSGIDMIDTIQKTYSPAFIILSAYSDFDYAKKALKMKVSDYLVKPFSDKDLEESLKNAIETIVESRNRQVISQKLESISNSTLATFNQYLSQHHTSKNTNLDKVLNIIHHRFSDNLSLKQIGEELLVSESYLSKLFKEESGYTFHDYLIQYRMKKACDFLSDNQIKIYEVADKIGFKDQRYFSVIFRKYVGMTPMQFKEKLVVKKNDK